MNEITLELLKLMVMVTIAVIGRYLIPLIKEQLGEVKMAKIRNWVNDAVLMAQQVHAAKPGAERKAIVVDLIRKMLLKKNIDISKEQLDTLIEAAVKAMKMQDKSSTSVKTFGT